MKLILAGLYGFLMLSLFVYLLTRFEPHNLIIVTLIGILYFIACSILGHFLFRDRFNFPKTSSEEIVESLKDIATLEKEGMLKRTKYRVKRYFTLEVDEDTGIYYFLELDNNQVFCVEESMLYSCPQELWDNVHEQFPTTEFTVVEHLTFGWVRNIEFGGDFLPPEHEFPEECMSCFANSDDIGGGLIPKVAYKRLVTAMKKVKANR